MKKSHKNTTSNISIVIVLVALLWFLYVIFKIDRDSILKHLTECREKCYPNQVIESLSNKLCVCQEPPQKEQDENVGP